jgi:hypothetical protein
MLSPKKRIIGFTLIGLIFAAAGCGLFSSPSRATKNFYGYVEAGNMDKAMELVSTQTKNSVSQDKLRAGLGEATRAIKQHGGIDSIEVTKEDITGDIANVIGTIKYKDGTSENINQKLVKEDGDWKLQ